MTLPISLPALSLAALLAAPALAQEAGTVTDREIDPQAYAGLWYEIAKVPMPYQSQCTGGATARYDLVDERTLRVVNRCDTEGGVAGVEGTAEVANGNLNTFSVQFPQSPGGQGVNYVVVAVGEEEGGSYPWSAVHSPEGGYAWILSRAPQLDAADRRTAEEALTAAGADVSKLVGTKQPPASYDPAQE